jgi:hypothetical protein
MGATTPVYALPYPAPTDPPDAPAQVRALAETSEAVLIATDAAVGDVDDRVDTVDARVTALDAATDTRLDAAETKLTQHTGELTSLDTRLDVVEALPAPSGVGGPPFSPAAVGRWAPVMGHVPVGTTATSVGLTQSMVVYQPLSVVAPTKINAVTVSCQTGGPTVLCGFYDNTGAIGPGARLAMGQVTGSSGLLVIPVVATLPVGRLWIAFTCGAANVTLDAWYTAVHQSVSYTDADLAGGNPQRCGYNQAITAGSGLPANAGTVGTGVGADRWLKMWIRTAP